MAAKTADEVTPEVAKEIKLTEEEWTTFRQIQTEYNTVMVQMGEIAYNKNVLEPRLNELYANEKQLQGKMDQIRGMQEEFGAMIGAKYGDGNIDLATGVFNPTTD